jgi:hypothetical protein
MIGLLSYKDDFVEFSQRLSVRKTYCQPIIVEFHLLLIFPLLFCQSLLDIFDKIVDLKVAVVGDPGVLNLLHSIR